MRWFLSCVLALGCGGSVGEDPKGGSGPVAEGGASGGFAGDPSAAAPTDGGGGTAGLPANAGGAAGTSTRLDGGGTAGASAAVGGSGGAPCQAIQQQAQQAADTSCSQDSDCDHPPHMAGDCLECGAIMNVEHEQSSLEAVRSVCQRFYDEGCQYPLHSCIARRLACVEGACSQ